jgi:hypothetical protein
VGGASPRLKMIFRSVFVSVTTSFFQVEWHVSMVMVWFIASWFIFFFCLFSLKNYNLIFFVVSFSTSVLIFFIQIFTLDSFLEVLFNFNFIIPSQFAIYIYTYINLIPILLIIFFRHFIELIFIFTLQYTIFFQFHTSIKNKIYFVCQFDPHSFNYYFFYYESFCVIDIPFPS